MPRTLIRGISNIEDGDVGREDLNQATAGRAVIRRLIAGTNVTISQTGADTGTGDVTFNAAGDVVGPAVATNNGIARFNSTTGKLIKNSTYTIDDLNNTLQSAFPVTNIQHVMQGEAIVSTFLRRLASNNASAILVFQKARGSMAAPANIAANDAIGKIQSSGYIAGVYTLGTEISTEMQAAIPSATDMESRVIIRMAAAGVGTVSDLLTLDHASGVNLASGAISLPSIATPAAPAVGKLKLFANNIAGKEMPAFRGDTGLAATLQSFLGRTRIGMWNFCADSSDPLGVFGLPVPSFVGFGIILRLLATTNLFTRMRRTGGLSASAAGSFAGVYNLEQLFTIGNGSGLGGFLSVMRFGVSDTATVAGARMFVGLGALGTLTNVEPNTLLNCIGVAKLSTSNNLHIVYGGSAAQTAIDLGANFPANTLSVDAYSLSLYADSGFNNQVKYRVERLNTGDVATGTLTAATPGLQLPLSTTLLSISMWRCNNATALAVSLDIMSVYVETEY